MTEPCDGDVCITCADQLLTVVVDSVDTDGLTARGHTDEGTLEIGVELIDDPHPGDVLLAHGGIALQRAQAGEETA